MNIGDYKFEGPYAATSLPSRSGIYAVYANNSLCYIGKAEDINDRITNQNHKGNDCCDNKGNPFYYFYLEANSDKRKKIETELIRLEKPPCN